MRRKGIKEFGQEGQGPEGHSCVERPTVQWVEHGRRQAGGVQSGVKAQGCCPALMAGPQWKEEDPALWGRVGRRRTGIGLGKQVGLNQAEGLGQGNRSSSPSVCWVIMAWDGWGQREGSDLVDPGTKLGCCD